MSTRHNRFARSAVKKQYRSVRRCSSDPGDTAARAHVGAQNRLEHVLVAQAFRPANGRAQP